MRLIIAAACLAALAAPAHAQTPRAASARDAIVPDWHQAWTDQLHFSAAVRAGDLVFLSGVVAGLPPGETEEAAMEAALERAFATLGRVLAAAGTDWDHVVDITTYHTDITAQMPIIARVKDRYVRAPYPTWTAIDVDRLYPPAGFVEIKLIARMPDPAPP